MTGWDGRVTPAATARLQVVLAGALGIVAALAWWLTDSRMDGLATGGWDLAGVGTYLGVWVLMMTAMMLPSAAPMVVVYERVRRARRLEAGGVGSSGPPLFVAGYLVAWTAAGLAAYLLIAAGEAIANGALDWHRAGREATAAVAILGAAYQLTPLKLACLRRCRTPFAFVSTHWRPGALGTVRLGVVHGAWCIGCCWALMAVLIAIGLMSLGWMAFIATLIAIEKLLPPPASRLVALVLLALGLALLAAPDLVPAGGGEHGAHMAM